MENNTQKIATTFENTINTFAFDPEKVADEFARHAHRYLQNEMARFCYRYLYLVAKDTYGHDGRNECAHKLANKLFHGECVAELDENY